MFHESTLKSLTINWSIRQTGPVLLCGFLTNGIARKHRCFVRCAVVQEFDVSTFVRSKTQIFDGQRIWIECRNQWLIFVVGKYTDVSNCNRDGLVNGNALDTTKFKIALTF